jgi:hypothetical protein
MVERCAHLSASKHPAQGRSVKAFNPIACFDSQLFVAVMSGEHAVHGVGPGVAEMAAAPSRLLP